MIGVSTNPEQLMEGKDATIKHRELFWDSVVLYLVSVILALSAVDVVLEFIRGSSVACNVPNGTSREYINNFCAGSVPITEFIPAFIFIHGLIIAMPHYLWAAHYGGYFDYFFSTVSLLDQMREENTGEYSTKNHKIVSKLESAYYNTYLQNMVFKLYRAKLVVQLVLAVSSVFLSIWLFTDFDMVFRCPRNNFTADPLWPLPEQVNCVFTSLKFLYWIRVADVILITLIFLSILRGLWWCASSHYKELSGQQVGIFTFQSGLDPNFYVPPVRIPSIFHKSPFTCLPKPLKRALLFIFTALSSRLGTPHISADIDFLLVKLYKTNAGTGHVFKDVQIDMTFQGLHDEDQQIVDLHIYRREYQMDISKQSACIILMSTYKK